METQSGASGFALSVRIFSIMVSHSGPPIFMAKAGAALVKASTRASAMRDFDFNILRLRKSRPHKAESRGTGGSFAPTD